MFIQWRTQLFRALNNWEILLFTYFQADKQFSIIIISFINKLKILFLSILFVVEQQNSFKRSKNIFKM
jgi:hypothetical protein